VFRLRCDREFRVALSLSLSLMARTIDRGMGYQSTPSLLISGTSGGPIP
jgi:hypothetical protein